MNIKIVDNLPLAGMIFFEADAEALKAIPYNIKPSESHLGCYYIPTRGSMSARSMPDYPDHDVALKMLQNMSTPASASKTGLTWAELDKFIITLGIDCLSKTIDCLNKPIVTAAEILANLQYNSSAEGYTDCARKVVAFVVKAKAEAGVK